MFSPERDTAILICVEMDSVEWCRCKLLLLLFCKFKDLYQGIGSPGNNGNIGPEQDYQEATN